MCNIFVSDILLTNIQEGGAWYVEYYALWRLMVSQSAELLVPLKKPEIRYCGIQVCMLKCTYRVGKQSHVAMCVTLIIPPMEVV